MENIRREDEDTCSRQAAAVVGPITASRAPAHSILCGSVLPVVVSCMKTVSLEGQKRVGKRRQQKTPEQTRAPCMRAVRPEKLKMTSQTRQQIRPDKSRQERTGADKSRQQDLAEEPRDRRG
jgi:hypothetical protein